MYIKYFVFDKQREIYIVKKQIKIYLNKMAWNVRNVTFKINITSSLLLMTLYNTKKKNLS